MTLAALSALCTYGNAVYLGKTACLALSTYKATKKIQSRVATEAAFIWEEAKQSYHSGQITTNLQEKITDIPLFAFKVALAAALAFSFFGIISIGKNACFFVDKELAKLCLFDRVMSCAQGYKNMFLTPLLPS